MLNAVRVFKAPLDTIQDTINGWAEANQATILSVSLCYNEGDGTQRAVAMIVYTRRIG